MPTGSRHVIHGAVVVFFLALAPAAAFAAGGGKCTASACRVYIEPSGPTAGRGQKPQSTGTGKVHVPPALSRVLQAAGKDQRPLRDLLAGSDIGSLRSSGNIGSPSALGAAFDLGAGPLALLLTLLAAAVGLSARGSVQSWLRKRSSS